MGFGLGNRLLSVWMELSLAPAVSGLPALNAGRIVWLSPNTAR